MAEQTDQDRAQRASIPAIVVLKYIDQLLLMIDAPGLAVELGAICTSDLKKQQGMALFAEKMRRLSLNCPWTPVGPEGPMSEFLGELVRQR